MRRREFITLLSGSAFTWPLAARAQQRAIPRIGYIWSGTPGAEMSIAGLRQGLTDRGYVVGRNLMIEERYAEGNPHRIPVLIDQLLALSIDVLVTPGTPITLAAQRATTTVPIVCITGNPVGSGLVASLSRPGGNITGMSLLSGEYSAKWLELLTKAAPTLHRIAVLWNPDNPAMIEEHGHLQATARVLGLALTFLSARPFGDRGQLGGIDAGNRRRFRGHR